ncbi:MAG: di-trans,poly-cis-decaprenylcistransferase [Chloroflexi bacterium]|nr:di-trans,poly-cis-decaprenylcistransferase [Chloroflexota bacterium]
MRAPAPDEIPSHLLPTHVAIIMDGNARWAGRFNLTRLDGHRTGTENVRRVIETFANYGVKYLTLYAFSTENWKRPKVEVRGLLRLLSRMIRTEINALHQKGVKIRHLGRLDRLSEKVQQEIRNAIELTKDNTTMTLSIAFDYGGRAEIVDATRRVVSDGIPADKIGEELFGSYLYSSGLPDPDLIIRTAGEMRLSNFLLWQSAYSELYFTSVPWPEFDEEEIRKALLAYSERERKFGG